MHQSGNMQWSADCCYTFDNRKVFTLKQKKKMTTIRARLNRSRLGNDGMYPLVIRIIHDRIKRDVHTPFRLRPEEFDARAEQAVSKGRTKERASYIKEANECIRFMKE